MRSWRREPRRTDHQAGSWNRLYSRDWTLIAPDKGSGGKDYHVIGACFDLLRLHGDAMPSPR